MPAIKVNNFKGFMSRVAFGAAGPSAAATSNVAGGIGKVMTTKADAIMRAGAIGQGFERGGLVGIYGTVRNQMGAAALKGAMIGAGGSAALQVVSNIANRRSTTEGIVGAGIKGGLTGGAIGGLYGAWRGIMPSARDINAANMSKSAAWSATAPAATVRAPTTGRLREMLQRPLTRAAGWGRGRAATRAATANVNAATRASIPMNPNIGMTGGFANGNPFATNLGSSLMGYYPAGSSQGVLSLGIGTGGVRVASAAPNTSHALGRTPPPTQLAMNFGRTSRRRR